MRCQLNKGIRSLLKSKSQSKINPQNRKSGGSRKPLGEVNGNLAANDKSIRKDNSLLAKHKKGSQSPKGSKTALHQARR